MTTYDVRDYQPGSGKLVKTDGSVVNKADGIELDGKQDMVLSRDDVKRSEVISTLPSQAITAGQVLAVSSLVDVSGYVAVSLTTWWNETPTSCTISVQETARTLTDMTDLLPVTGAQSTQGNSLYCSRSPLKLGVGARIRIQNADTVTHNLAGATLIGWRY